MAGLTAWPAWTCMDGPRKLRQEPWMQLSRKGSQCLQSGHLVYNTQTSVRTQAKPTSMTLTWQVLENCWQVPVVFQDQFNSILWIVFPCSHDRSTQHLGQRFQSLDDRPAFQRFWMKQEQSSSCCCCCWKCKRLPKYILLIERMSCLTCKARTSPGKKKTCDWTCGFWLLA
jgi:hypothetical protein